MLTVRDFMRARTMSIITDFVVVIIYISAARLTVPSVNHQPSLFSCFSLHSLEFLACPCLIITIYLNFLATAKTFSFHKSFPDIII